MEYAIDRSDGSRVFAEDAHWSRHAYICPCCRTEVYRVGSGTTAQSPHFRHMPGVASEGCDNYHPGYQCLIPDLTTSKDSELGQRLALCVRLDHKDEEVDWNLELSLPKAGDPNGAVSFYTSRGLRTIPLSTLMLGGRKEPVDYDREYYEVMVSPEVCDRYRAMVSGRLEGLDRQNFNIFRFSESSGRSVDPSKPLYFDELYLSVSPLTLSHADLREFVAFPCQAKGGWVVFGFVVPRSITDERKRVVEQVLRRNIVARPPSIRLVYPPIMCESPDGRTVVERESELVFSVEGTLPETSLEVAVICSDELENQSFILSGNDRFFAITTPNSNEAILHFPGIQGSELYLELYEEAVTAPTGSVSLEFMSRKHKHVFSSTALNPSCSVYLRRVREGTAKLMSVSNPHSRETTILHRQISYPFWRERVTHTDTAAQVINQLLQDSNDEVWLNFSNFGGPVVLVDKSNEPSLIRINAVQAKRLDAFLTRTLQARLQGCPVKTLTSLKASVRTHSLSREEFDCLIGLLGEAGRTVCANSMLRRHMRNDLESVKNE